MDQLERWSKIRALILRRLVEQLAKVTLFTDFFFVARILAIQYCPQ